MLLKKFGEKLIYGLGFGLGMGISFKILKVRAPTNKGATQKECL